MKNSAAQILHTIFWFAIKIPDVFMPDSFFASSFLCVNFFYSMYRGTFNCRRHYF